MRKEKITPLLTSSDATELTQPTRVALRNGIDRVRFYYKVVKKNSATPQIKEITAKQTPSKLGHVTYFLYDKQQIQQCGEQESVYYEDIFHHPKIHSAIRLFNYRTAEEETVTYIPLRTKRVRRHGPIKGLITYKAINYRNDGEMKGLFSAPIRRGDEFDHELITRSRNTILNNGATGTGPVVTELTEMNVGLNDSPKPIEGRVIEGSPTNTTPDTSITYHFNKRVDIASALHTYYSKEVYRPDHWLHAMQGLLLTVDHYQDHNHCKLRVNEPKMQQDRDVTYIDRDEVTYIDDIYKADAALKPVCEEINMRYVRAVTTINQSRSVHLITARSPDESRLERKQRLILVKDLIHNYFSTSRIKITVFTDSLRSLLHHLAKLKRLQPHPASSIQGLCRAKAILCLDGQCAALIRHSQLYILWETADLLDIGQNQLGIIVSQNPCEFYVDKRTHML